MGYVANRNSGPIAHSEQTNYNQSSQKRKQNNQWKMKKKEERIIKDKS